VCVCLRGINSLTRHRKKRLMFFHLFSQETVRTDYLSLSLSLTHTHTLSLILWANDLMAIAAHLWFSVRIMESFEIWTLHFPFGYPSFSVIFIRVIQGDIKSFLGSAIKLTEVWSLWIKST